MRSALLALAAGLALLVVAGPWDLALSGAVADPDLLLARVVRDYGETPAWVLTAGALVFLVGCRCERRAHLVAPARATVLLALLHPLLLTQALKYLWGRVRPRDLASAAEFTSWWWPAGPGAGDSFPSGHVAMASVTLVLALWLARRRRWALAAVPAAYVLLVAVGRVLAGAHYLTDVLASVVVGAALALALLRPTVPTARSGGGARAPRKTPSTTTVP